MATGSSMGFSHLTSISASKQIEWVMADKDIPKFGIVRGRHLAFAPIAEDRELEHDEVYLFRTEIADAFLGTYMALADGDFEAISDKGERFTNRQHGLTRVAELIGVLKPSPAADLCT